MSSQDKREILKEETEIRHSGNVDVTTIPSKISNSQPVKAAKGKKTPIRLIQEGDRWFLEIELPIEFVRQGRYLIVQRKEEK